MHALKKRLQSEREERRATHNELDNAFVNKTDAGPTGSDESTIMASYDPASASCPSMHNKQLANTPGRAKRRTATNLRPSQMFSLTRGSYALMSVRFHDERSHGEPQIQQQRRGRIHEPPACKKEQVKHASAACCRPRLRHQCVDFSDVDTLH